MIKKYPLYNDYQDAQCQWLDLIPKHWIECRLKQIVSERITDGPHETPKFEDDGVPFLSAESVKERKLDFSRKRGFISRELHKVYSKKCLPQRGDIFMVKSGATTGALAIVETDEEFNIWSPLAVIRTNRLMAIERFVFYSMQSDFFQRSIQLSWTYGTQPNIGMGVIENLYIARPTLEEQRTIAAFLDYETGKIDALIEKQEQLIALLQEKRQAVISHAVTKGLDPHAPMRDSGIEWLGDIPADWEATRLKYHVYQIVDGTHITPTYVEKGIPFLRVTDIKSFPINQDEVKYIPELEHQELIKRCRPERGDLLLSKNGTIGVPRIIDWDWEFSIFVSLCLIKLKKSLDVRFLFYYFLTHQIKEQIFGLIKQSTVINLHLDKIENFWLALPNIQEQKSITAYLDSIVGKYDLQIDYAESINQLLQERRTALISAAVTGKIDVRGWQPPEPTTTTEDA